MDQRRKKKNSDIDNIEFASNLQSGWWLDIAAVPDTIFILAHTLRKG